jgi:hypothetical protein
MMNMVILILCVVIVLPVHTVILITNMLLRVILRLLKMID